MVTYNASSPDTSARRRETIPQNNPEHQDINIRISPTPIRSIHRKIPLTTRNKEQFKNEPCNLRII